MNRWKSVACVALAVGALTACSGSSGGDGEQPESLEATTAATSEAPGGDIPDCASIWATGKTLPEDYRQCHTEAGATDGVVGQCTDGVRFLASYDKFYGFTGEEIKEFPVEYVETPDASPQFREAFDDCAGE